MSNEKKYQWEICFKSAGFKPVGEALNLNGTVDGRPLARRVTKEEALSFFSIYEYLFSGKDNDILKETIDQSLDLILRPSVNGWSLYTIDSVLDEDGTNPIWEIFISRI